MMLNRKTVIWLAEQDLELVNFGLSHVQGKMDEALEVPKDRDKWKFDKGARTILQIWKSRLLKRIEEAQL